MLKIREVIVPLIAKKNSSILFVPKALISEDKNKRLINGLGLTKTNKQDLANALKATIRSQTQINRTNKDAMFLSIFGTYKTDGNQDITEDHVLLKRLIEAVTKETGDDKKTNEILLGIVEQINEGKKAFGNSMIFVQGNHESQGDTPFNYVCSSTNLKLGLKCLQNLNILGAVLQTPTNIGSRVVATADQSTVFVQAESVARIARSNPDTLAFSCFDHFELSRMMQQIPCASVPNFTYYLFQSKNVAALDPKEKVVLRKYGSTFSGELQNLCLGLKKEGVDITQLSHFVDPADKGVLLGALNKVEDVIVQFSQRTALTGFSKNMHPERLHSEKYQGGVSETYKTQAKELVAQLKKEELDLRSLIDFPGKENIFGADEDIIQKLFDLSIPHDGAWTPYEEDLSGQKNQKSNGLDNLPILDGEKSTMEKYIERLNELAQTEGLKGFREDSELDCYVISLLKMQVESIRLGAHMFKSALTDDSFRNLGTGGDAFKKVEQVKSKLNLSSLTAMPSMYKLDIYDMAPTLQMIGLGDIEDAKRESLIKAMLFAQEETKIVLTQLDTFNENMFNAIILKCLEAREDLNRDNLRFVLESLKEVSLCSVHVKEDAPHDLDDQFAIMLLCCLAKSGKIEKLTIEESHTPGNSRVDNSELVPCYFAAILGDCIVSPNIQWCRHEKAEGQYFRAIQDPPKAHWGITYKKLDAEKQEIVRQVNIISEAERQESLKRANHILIIGPTHAY